MQVVILITDGREQGNSLDYEAEEAKKDLDSLPQNFESHKSSFWHEFDCSWGVAIKYSRFSIIIMNPIQE